MGNPHLPNLLLPLHPSPLQTRRYIYPLDDSRRSLRLHDLKPDHKTSCQSTETEDYRPVASDLRREGCDCSDDYPGHGLVQAGGTPQKDV